MIYRPKSIHELKGFVGLPQAGGTDIQDRIRKGLLSSPIVDLHRVPDLKGVSSTEGRIVIGAMTTIQELSTSGLLQAHYGLVEAAKGLATPQIRRMATLGGNLLQEVRCAYLRSGQFSCFKTGNDGCPSRSGLHEDQVAIDSGGCIAPHPSTMALAMLCWDATVDLTSGASRAISDIYPEHGKGPTHLLGPGEVLRSVSIEAVSPGEKSAWFRYSQRRHAEWPLVEAVVRIVTDGTQIQRAYVAMGGVSVSPLRVSSVEHALIGTKIDRLSMNKCAENAIESTLPLPGTRYKLPLMVQCIQDAFEIALRG